MSRKHNFEFWLHGVTPNLARPGEMNHHDWGELLCPRPVGGGAGVLSGDRRPSSVCLMSRTSALTRKPKGLGRRNFAQGYPRSHATPTPTSRSKGQKSRSQGGGILWRPPSRTACYNKYKPQYKSRFRLDKGDFRANNNDTVTERKCHLAYVGRPCSACTVGYKSQ